MQSRIVKDLMTVNDYTEYGDKDFYMGSIHVCVGCSFISGEVVLVFLYQSKVSNLLLCVCGTSFSICVTAPSYPLFRRI